MKEIILPAIEIKANDFKWLEDYLKEFFLKEIYKPMMKELPFNNKTLLENAAADDYDSLIGAIRSGKIVFYRGRFKGQLSAQITKDLRKLNAEWYRAEECYYILFDKLPAEVQSAIKLSESNFSRVVATLNKKINSLDLDSIIGKINVEKFFDTKLMKMQKSVSGTLKGITVAPKLTDDARKNLVEKYTENMKLSIKGFTEEQIVKLRKDIEKQAMTGNRYENLIESIAKRYKISQNRAKFIARQETSLVMAKFKEERYASAGVDDYIWNCVHNGPHGKHPVRPRHWELNGTRQKFSKPPIVTEPGQPVRRCNPGEDFGCRCGARPIVKFK